MLKLFYWTSAVSICLNLSITRVALSLPAMAPQPAAPTNVDVPLCYMQTANGAIMDLQQLCTQNSISNTNPANSTVAVKHDSLLDTPEAHNAKYKDFENDRSSKGDDSH